MKIDEQEIRFWVRKIKSIKEINTQIEKNLKTEIPKFLRYLHDLPEIDLTKSRMVFTSDEINNKSLEKVKTESWSGLKKELNLLIINFFYEHLNESVPECS